MANNTYFSGAENLRDLMNGQGVYIDLSDPNAAELSLQRQDSQQILSPAIHQRHDSFFSCSSLNTPRHSISQHQAEPQPYANLHQNLHSPNIYSQHPVNNGMSRSASQYSSTSSGQQPHPHSLQRSSRGSFGSTLVTNGSEMSRSISSTSAGQRTTLQPYPLPSHSQTGHFHTRRSSELSPNMNYDQFSTTAISPFDYTINATPGEGVLGDEDEDRAFGQIGYDNESSNLLSTFGSSSRAPQEPFDTHVPHQNQLRMISPQHVVRDSPSPQSSRSPTLSSPTSPPHANRRRRHKSDPPTNRTDPIIGQVTLSGKFKCLKETCLNNGEDMTFNRHADFKRHYDNTHAGRCVEYFCQEPGCPRSRNPEGGKKGRGFKGRKDKRNEHYKAVHQKESKKRKHVYESDEYAEGRGYEDNTGARPLKVRQRSDTS